MYQLKISLLNILVLGGCLFFGGCTPTPDTTINDPDHSESHNDHVKPASDEEASQDNRLQLLPLDTADLDNNPLQVVATTSIIGDVVYQVGGDVIELTTLIAPGQDAHSYEPGARDLTAVASAQVIFVNGWGLEESLIEDLEEITEGGLLIPISAGIDPLTGQGDTHDHESDESEHESHQHGRPDPHVWFKIAHVKQWVENVETVFSALDPDNAEMYRKNAAAYLAELDLLAAYATAELAKIPNENKTLVTNHNSFAYFAEAYDFQIVGTVLSANSTTNEPSIKSIASLIEAMEDFAICTIFTEYSFDDTLAQTISQELSHCDTVQVLSLYTEALGTADSVANSYINMYRANIDTLVLGLGHVK